MKSEIVAEIGSNWEGRLPKAFELIKKCKESGADGVKFQLWRAHDLYNRTHPNWSEIKKSELTFEQAKKMKQYADRINIDFFCSAFYPEAIDFLQSIKVKKYKIASRTCLFSDPFSTETLEKKASTKKPIIISMGMGGNKKKVLNIFSKNQVLFCYCISDYPLDIKKINWNEAIKFDGFSDHTMGITAPIIYATLKKFKRTKKIYIEKHVKLKTSKGPDADTSIDTEQLNKLIKHIRLIEKIK